jgi:hypothetical protein
MKPTSTASIGNSASATLVLSAERLLVIPACAQVSARWAVDRLLPPQGICEAPRGEREPIF